MSQNQYKGRISRDVYLERLQEAYQHSIGRSFDLEKLHACLNERLDGVDMAQLPVEKALELKLHLMSLQKCEEAWRSSITTSLYAPCYNE